jgi:hypothetical protein
MAARVLGLGLSVASAAVGVLVCGRPRVACAFRMFNGNFVKFLSPFASHGNVSHDEQGKSRVGKWKL